MGLNPYSATAGRPGSLTNIQTVRGMRDDGLLAESSGDDGSSMWAMTESGRTALAAADAHKSIRVSGCAECPAHHDEAGNGEWCGLDETHSHSHPVRNSANPDAPAHPGWCPLAAGPVVLSLS